MGAAGWTGGGRPRAGGGGGSAMAPRGRCRWALLLAWLPAGEWGRAGVAVVAVGSLPPPRGHSPPRDTRVAQGAGARVAPSGFARA